MKEQDNSFFSTIKKLISYGLNGIVNTAVTYALFVVISNFIDYRITIAIVFVPGVLLSYFLNRKITFKVKGSIIVFSIIMGIMFLTNLSITWILVETFQIPKEISQLIAIGVVFFIGFGLNKRFAFRE